MRDKTHIESVEKWAAYVRTHPDWKKIHTQFVNAQLQKAYDAMHKIAKQPNGKKKLKELYGIQNENGYKKLLSGK